jgi:phospholipase A1
MKNYFSYVSIILVFLVAQKILSADKATVSPEPEKSLSIIHEYRPNYLIAGKPNTKIQFSFKLKLLQADELYLGYTQTMFWELGRRSNPFSEINYNPELFYQFIQAKNSYFNYIYVGYGHISNGLEEQASKSIDMFFLDFHSDEQMKTLEIYFLLRIQALFNEDEFNRDIREYYGPLNLKVYFNKLAEKLLSSEELYIEYYNCGRLAQNFRRSSYRISLRAKPWNDKASPKLFIQYFNGFAENLRNYNSREETYRLGLSIGGM